MPWLSSWLKKKDKEKQKEIKIIVRKKRGKYEQSTKEKYEWKYEEKF